MEETGKMSSWSIAFVAALFFSLAVAGYSAVSTFRREPPAPAAAIAPERSGPLSELERETILADAPRVEPGNELSVAEIEDYIQRMQSL